MVLKMLSKIVGESNEKAVSKVRPLVKEINDLEPQFQAMSDEQLHNLTTEFRERLEAGETLDDLLPEAFAAVREASQRTLGMRHFDVQLVGGIVLHEGKIAEMKTGEGKTLVATLPAYLNALANGVHIVTVKFQDVNPPESVKAAFNEVNEAEQEKESMIFQAREQYNKEVPKATGVAKSTILEAEGYALERLNQARGESDRFLALLTEYRKAPKVTRQRLYLETMEKILPAVDEIYVMDKNGAGALPLLPLRSGKGGSEQ